MKINNYTPYDQPTLFDLEAKFNDRAEECHAIVKQVQHVRTQLAGHGLVLEDLPLWHRKRLVKCASIVHPSMIALDYRIEQAVIWTKRRRAQQAEATVIDMASGNPWGTEAGDATAPTDAQRDTYW